MVLCVEDIYLIVYMCGWHADARSMRSSLCARTCAVSPRRFDGGQLRDAHARAPQSDLEGKSFIVYLFKVED